MTPLDWFVLIATILTIVIYGVKKSQKSLDLNDFLRSNKDLRWTTIGISIIATQASAITFLSMPGQAYDDGMRFIQLYFGVPIAMIILSITFVPLYHKLNIYTAYEFLEKRFDFKTRVLGALLFLIQRGLAVGFTIYAPALIFSNILGWNIYWTSIIIGGIVIAFTVLGGSKAISIAHRQQMLIILLGMGLAGFLLVDLFPEDLPFEDALLVAGKMGKLNTIDLSFDINERYNIWSGVLGGLFLSLSYFGTDQSQVQRYIGAKSIKASRFGLMFNGLIKVPMQFSILFIGVLLFVFYQFERPPIFFNQPQRTQVYQSEYVLDLQFLESQHSDVFDAKKEKIKDMLRAYNSGADEKGDFLQKEIKDLDQEARDIKSEAVRLIAMQTPGVNTNDLDQIFLTFITTHLPPGIVGLLIAVIILASMSSSSSILSALASTSVIDIYKRIFRQNHQESSYLNAGKKFTVFWGVIGILFALYANKVGNLIQAVNILGSLFYGSILGIFLAAFYIKRIQGHAIFWAAIIGEICVLIFFILSDISFLWFNVIGCLLVIILAYLIQIIFFRKQQKFKIKDYLSN